MIEEIETSIETATMGFALMNVMDDCDLKRGPTTTAQAINIRPIDDAYLKTFAANTKKQGLKNRTSDNAIIIGVDRSFVDPTSLKPIQLGLYDNHVRWTDQGKSAAAKMLLYNGNHRRIYMREHGDGIKPYRQFVKAQLDLESNDLTEEAKEATKVALEEAKKQVEENGCWLVRFVDVGKHK